MTDEETRAKRASALAEERSLMAEAVGRYRDFAATLEDLPEAPDGYPDPYIIERQKRAARFTALVDDVFKPGIRPSVYEVARIARIENEHDREEAIATWKGRPSRAVPPSGQELDDRVKSLIEPDAWVVEPEAVKRLEQLVETKGRATTAEWLGHFPHISIVDPDGWRDVHPVNEPITQAEFWRRVNASSQGPLGQNKWLEKMIEAERRASAEREPDEHDQPMPTVSSEGPSMQDLVINDIEERKRIGLARYGTLLRPGNGRDMLVDAYEEALDLGVYLRGAIAEREHRPDNLPDVVSFILDMADEGSGLRVSAEETLKLAAWIRRVIRITS